MRYEIPIQIVELEPENYHLLLEGSLDHKIPCFWIIDTGASRSVFDQDMSEWYVIDEESDTELQSAGITGEFFAVHTAKLKSLFFSEFNVSGKTIALISLNQINELYSRFSDIKISGLIGGDWLKRYNAIIDYKQQLLILED